MQTGQKADLVTAVFVLLGLLMPLVANIFTELDVRPAIHENRQMWEMPVLGETDAAIYVKQFESYFNDRFGYRNLLIKLNNRVKFELFRVSGSQMVLFGRDGWLYYNSDNMLDDHRGVSVVGDEEVQAWYDALCAKKDWLAARGVAYVFVIVPDKHTVYPEHLPDGHGNSGRPTPLERFADYVSTSSDVYVIDLRIPLLDNKGCGQLYRSTDTHWTELGAYIGYLAIMDTLSSISGSVDVHSLDRVDISVKREPGGDLARMLGLQDSFEEELPSVSPVDTGAVTLFEGRFELIKEMPGGGRQRAVMFHDSFGKHMEPFMSESFRMIRYIHGPWTDSTDMEAVIIETKPDVVIEEIVERNIRDISGYSPGLVNAVNISREVEG